MVKLSLILFDLNVDGEREEWYNPSLFTPDRGAIHEALLSFYHSFKEGYRDKMAISVVSNVSTRDQWQFRFGLWDIAPPLTGVLP